MAQLLDRWGNPIKKSTLDRPQAGPTLGGVRQVIAANPAAGLTPGRLAGIHRAAAEGEPLAYFELAEDIEERDLHYLGVLSTRRRAVSQLPVTVTAVSDAPEHRKHAEFVKSWIDDGVLQASLFDMLDAIGKGVSIMEMDWRMHAGHLCPREFVYRPQRWFNFDRTDGETVLLREGVDGEPLMAHKFVVHKHKAKSGLTIRAGLARIASWSWMYKAFTVKDWAIFAQNFGAPIRIGKYGPNASEEEKDILWRAVSNIAGDCAAIVPASMSIEFQEVGAKSASTDLFERRADWLDRQVSKLVLGQTTTTDAVSGGHAVAKEHRLVQEDIERADAMMMSGTVNAQIVPNMVAFNFGPQEHYPVVRIGRPDEVELGVFATAFKELGPMGLTAPLGWLRERMGIPAPKPEDELVGGVPAAATPPEEDPAKPARATRRAAMARRDEADLAETMTARLEADAAGALAGMADEIRAALDAATDLADAKDRLARLDLDPRQFSAAMARGMAMAHLAGQAALVEDIEGRK